MNLRNETWEDDDDGGRRTSGGSMRYKWCRKVGTPETECNVNLMRLHFVYSDVMASLTFTTGTLSRVTSSVSYVSIDPPESDRADVLYLSTRRSVYIAIRIVISEFNCQRSCSPTFYSFHSSFKDSWKIGKAEKKSVRSADNENSTGFNLTHADEFPRQFSYLDVEYFIKIFH